MQFFCDTENISRVESASTNHNEINGRKQHPLPAVHKSRTRSHARHGILSAASAASHRPYQTFLIMQYTINASVYDVHILCWCKQRIGQSGECKKSDWGEDKFMRVLSNRCRQYISGVNINGHGGIYGAGRSAAADPVLYLGGHDRYRTRVLDRGQVG